MCNENQKAPFFGIPTNATVDAEKVKYYEDKLAAIINELPESAQRFAAKLAEGMGCIQEVLKLKSPRRKGGQSQSNGAEYVTPTRYPFNGQRIPDLMPMEQAGPEFVYCFNPRFGLSAAELMQAFEPLREQMRKQAFAASDLRPEHGVYRGFPCYQISFLGREKLQICFLADVELWAMFVDGEQWAFGGDTAIRGHESGWHIEVTGSRYERAKVLVGVARGGVLKMPIPAIVAQRNAEHEANKGAGQRKSPVEFGGYFYGAGATEYQRNRRTGETPDAYFARVAKERSGHVGGQSIDCGIIDEEWYLSFGPFEELAKRLYKPMFGKPAPEPFNAKIKEAAEQLAGCRGEVDALGASFRKAAESMRMFAGTVEGLPAVVGCGFQVPLPPVSQEERVAPEFIGEVMFPHYFGNEQNPNRGRVYYSAFSDNWVIELVSVGIIAEGCTNRVLSADWLKFDAAVGISQEAAHNARVEARVYVQSRGEALLTEWMEANTSHQ